MLAMLMRKVRSVLPDPIGLSSQNGLDLEAPAGAAMDGNLGWLGIALGQRAQNPADSEVVVHPGTAATHSTAHGQHSSQPWMARQLGRWQCWQAPSPAPQSNAPRTITNSTPKTDTVPTRSTIGTTPDDPIASGRAITS
ncbi:hypothetical protein Purlil1_1885 [Purpureocillium lilacinum]|uniref:Uncharacterized protein n=1 Tax=Purpureocillium lilacinum TaxID=33203 RepID=A0ABR0CB38_PURLI|nr:hypothetical protein Purlil1_1885 [Purpureocillium lilacinum]